MPKEIEDYIWIVNPENTETSGRRSNTQDTGGLLRDELENAQLENVETLESRDNATPVPAKKLKEEMSKFLKIVDYVFSEAQQQPSGLELDELTLSVEINAQGQVNLFGIGSTAGSKGTIQLKFKRKNG